MIHISREVHTVTQAPDWGLVFYGETCFFCIWSKESIPFKQSSSGMLDIPGPLSIGGLSC